MGNTIASQFDIGVQNRNTKELKDMEARVRAVVPGDNAEDMLQQET